MISANDMLASSAPKAPLGRLPRQLTQRQTEILGLLRDGLCTKKIALTLNLSPGTVDNHISNLMSALYADSRIQVVALGLQHGYLPRAC